MTPAWEIAGAAEVAIEASRGALVAAVCASCICTETVSAGSSADAVSSGVSTGRGLLNEGMGPSWRWA